MTERHTELVYRARPASRRPHMTLENRAKIFTPFAALRGFDISILTEEKNRVLVPRAALCEQALEEMERTVEQLRPGDAVRLTYFLPQRCAEGTELGVYRTEARTFLEIDRERRLLLTEDGAVPLDDIRLLEAAAQRP